MKQILFGLFLLALAAPVFANDRGGDIAYIPDYQELVREGYGPRHERYRQEARQQEQAPKPTQAFYGNGFTIYYGYTAVRTRTWNPASKYAFGYPLEFFKQMMPNAGQDVNLSTYAVAVANARAPYHPGDPVGKTRTIPNFFFHLPVPAAYGPGDFAAKAKKEHEQAISKVQNAANPANGTANPAATGEKTAR